MPPKLPSPCMWCLQAAKWLPVLFIAIVLLWSYYAYVIQLNLFYVKSIIEKCFYLLVYHILLVLFVWAYWQTIFTDIGTVPKQFLLPSSVLDRYESAETDDARRNVLEEFVRKQNLPVYNRTVTGDLRFCDRCCHIKPDRCHHCSVCGKCVLKMDHHCPWVNNCVAFGNYKFFILFLGYALIYCLFIASTTLFYFIKFWRNELNGVGKFHILFSFFVSVMFAISLVSLFGYHCYLIFKNRSTLESFRAPIFKINQTWLQDKEGFSLGPVNNFVEVFGDDRRLWFLPVFSSLGSGVSFPVSGYQPSSASHDIPEEVTVEPSLGDGVTYPQRYVEEDMDGLLSPRHPWGEEEEMGTMYNSQGLEEIVVHSNHTNPV